METLKKLIFINAGIGLLAILTNGGAAAMMINDSQNWGANQIAEAITIALTGAALVSIAFFWTAKKLSDSQAITYQKYILLVLTLVLIAWAVSLLLTPHTGTEKVSWLFGILTLLAWYVTHLNKVSNESPLSNLLASNQWIICCAVAIVDFAVFFKIGF
jgi:hypothetical protein